MVIATVGVSGEQPRIPFHSKVSFGYISAAPTGSETVLRAMAYLEVSLATKKVKHTEKVNDLDGNDRWWYFWVSRRQRHLVD